MGATPTEKTQQSHYFWAFLHLKISNIICRTNERERERDRERERERERNNIEIPGLIQLTSMSQSRAESQLEAEGR